MSTNKPGTCISDADLQGAGDLYIVSVGVDSSADPESRDWYSRDARHIRQALVPAESFYNSVHSRLLVGENATRDAVLEALTWLADSVQSTDIVLLFVSAHGDMDADKGYYICLTNTGGTQFDNVVFGTELNEALSKIQGKTVVLMDTCHSGGVIASMSVGGNKPAFVLACREEENSWGQYEQPDCPHGYFVIAACEALLGLADANNDKIVTFLELSNYVEARTRALLPKKQHPVLQMQDGCNSIPLAKVDDKGYALQQLWTAKNVRNPFGEFDVCYPNGTDVLDFAANVSLKGDDADANAEPWATRSSQGQTFSLDGEWQSRWNSLSKVDDWKYGTAEIVTKEGRVYIRFAHDLSGTVAQDKRRQADSGEIDIDPNKTKQEPEYLFDTGPFEKDLLAGRYVYLLEDMNDSSPWAGRVVNSERIDGQYNAGRWDFRRKLSRKNSM